MKMRWLFPFLLLTFVFHANSDDVSSLLEYEIYKTTFKYYDTYIYSRYLETENQTCQLSKKVIHNLQNLSAPDIWDSLGTVSKQLDKVKTIVEGGDDESCVQEIRNSWNDFVSQENNSLKQRLQSALIEQEKHETIASEVFNNYTLARKNLTESLEDCVKQFLSDEMLCVSEARKLFQKEGGFRTLAVTGRDQFLRPCMNAFESSVGDYHTERSQRIVEEAGRLRTNLYKCSNQSENSKLAEAIATFEVPAPTNSSSSMKLAQKLYDHSHNHIWVALDSFLDVEIKWLSTLANLYYHPETILWKRPRRHYADYVYALEAVLYNYPHLENSKCSSVRQELNVIVRNGHKEIEACQKTYADIIHKSLSEGGEKFKNITGELSKAGNIAILDCINDPYTFRKNRTEECYILKFGKFNNTWDKVERELEDIKAKLNIYLDNKGGPPGSPELCHNFLYQRMLLRESQAMYDFRKCLYLETGIEYDVTLPHIPRYPYYSKRSSVPLTGSLTTGGSPSTSPSSSSEVGE